MKNDRVRIAAVALGAVVALLIFLFNGEDASQELETGACISTDQGIEVVDCDSDDADQRLVKFAGTTYDSTDPDCPEGSEAIGIRNSEDAVGQRWCAEDL